MEELSLLACKVLCTGGAFAYSKIWVLFLHHFVDKPWPSCMSFFSNTSGTYSTQSHQRMRGVSGIELVVQNYFKSQIESGAHQISDIHAHVFLAIKGWVATKVITTNSSTHWRNSSTPWRNSSTRWRVPVLEFYFEKQSYAWNTFSLKLWEMDCGVPEF